MKSDDMWEWEVLLYVATVLLRRSEAQFWRMTPRKLNALTNAHIEMNTSPEDKAKGNAPGKQTGPRPGYIDQIIF